MRVTVLKEVHPGERRVAASPKTVAKLAKLGFSVSLEQGAGEGSSYPDSLYEDAGATIGARSFAAVLADADIIIKVRPPKTTRLPSSPKARR